MDDLITTQSVYSSPLEPGCFFLALNSLSIKMLTCPEFPQYFSPDFFNHPLFIRKRATPYQKNWHSSSEKPALLIRKTGTSHQKNWHSSPEKPALLIRKTGTSHQKNWHSSPEKPALLARKTGTHH